MHRFSVRRPPSKILVARVALAAAVIATVCGPAANGQVGDQTSTRVGSSAAEYRVAAPDVLRVEVYDEEALTGSYTVAADGTITFPLLGPVEVAGRKVDEIRELLTRLLERDYLYDAKVSVEVSEYRSQKVDLMGRVAKPGTYYLSGPTRLLDLLALAGGVAPSADEIRKGQLARVLRSDDGDGGERSQTLSVDLHDLLISGSDEANVELRGGDVVLVVNSDLVHVVGEVKRPGSFPLEEDMTVLKAITLAGGPTPRAAPRRAVIRRISDGSEQRIKAQMDSTQEPDDIVEVPVGFW